MKKMLLFLMAFVSFNAMSEGGMVDSGRTPSTQKEMDLDECQNYYASGQGEAETEDIFNCKLESAFWSKYNEETLQQDEDLPVATNEFIGLINVLTMQTPTDTYLVFPFLMLLMLGGVVIGMVKRLVEDKSVKLSFQEKTRLAFGALIVSGGFWFVVSATLIFSVFLMTFFTAKYNEAVLQYKGDSIFTNDEMNGQLKAKSLELAKTFAESSLSAKIMENQQIMIGINHEEPLQEQLELNEFYNCITGMTGSFPVGTMTNRYLAIKECNKDRNMYLEPPVITTQTSYNGVSETYEAIHAEADNFVNDYLKYYCGVSSDGFNNGGSNNGVLCSDFRTGEFYEKLSLEGRSPYVLEEEQKIIFNERLKEYYRNVSDLYFDYIQAPLTKEEEPELIKIKEDMSDSAKLAEYRANPYSSFLSLVFTENQLCSKAADVEDVVFSDDEVSSMCVDYNNLPNVYKKYRFESFLFNDSKVIGSNEAVIAAYETDTERLVKEDLLDTLTVVNEEAGDYDSTLNDREFFIEDPLTNQTKLNLSKGLVVKELFISCEDNVNLRNCEMVMSTIPNIYLYYKSALIASSMVWGGLNGMVKAYDYKIKNINKDIKNFQGAGINSGKFKALKSRAEKRKKLERHKLFFEEKAKVVKMFFFSTLFALLMFFLLIIILCWRVFSVIVHGSLTSHIIAPFLFMNGSFNKLFGFLMNIAINITATVVAIILSTLVFNFGLSILLEILMAVIDNSPSLYIIMKSNTIFLATTMFYSMFLFIIISNITKAIGEDLSVRLDNTVGASKGDIKNMRRDMGKAVPVVFGR